MDEIIINGKKYIPEESVSTLADTLDGMPYCMVRTNSAGVFAGYVERREGQEATLRKARRIWYWAGAASLSQLAMEGTSKPEECKFPCAVDTVILTGVIEIIPTTTQAKESIAGVPVWAE